jgi:hypothetical protein
LRLRRNPRRLGFAAGVARRRRRSVFEDALGAGFGFDGVAQVVDRVNFAVGAIRSPHQRRFDAQFGMPRSPPPRMIRAMPDDCA